ncbi:MAG: hypothetical protein AAGC55_18770, partial [Myxococcota bacterium]
MSGNADGGIIETDSGTPDGPAIDSPPVCTAYDPAHLDPCALPTPTDALSIPPGDHVYNTDLEMFVSGNPPSNPLRIVVSQSNGIEVLAWSLTGLEVIGSLRVEGSRPLVVVTQEAITVSGEVDAASRRDETPGAGANPAICTVAMQGEADEGGGGGSGGGAFQGVGGNGGPGDSNDNNSDGTSSGGSGANAIPVPTTVRGGCPGADGGPGTAGVSGSGGSGGGAIELVSFVSISVSGTIHSGGAGGSSGPLQRGGGAGGGSGGYIGLDAPVVTVDGAILAANGGGGGQGGFVDGVGPSGQDARPDGQRALGGVGPGQASDGGQGGAGDLHDGESATEYLEGGGGGGGGGVGYI